MDRAIFYRFSFVLGVDLGLCGQRIFWVGINVGSINVGPAIGRGPYGTRYIAVGPIVSGATQVNSRSHGGANYNFYIGFWFYFGDIVGVHGRFAN